MTSRAAAEALAPTRPTAVNLRWAVERVLAARPPMPPRIEAEAVRIHEEQIEADARMGELGAALIPDGATVLTHCNTGSLATGGIGTALGVIKTAHRQGKRIRVLVDETRPLLQGARLTAWELRARGHPARDHRRCGGRRPDRARPTCRRSIVGADRIAANGDVANKVGHVRPRARRARARRAVLRRRARRARSIPRRAMARAIEIEERDAERSAGVR